MMKIKNTPYNAYQLMLAIHGDVTEVSISQQAEWLHEIIGKTMYIQPAYLNNAPLTFWEHKIETGEIQIMR